MAEFGGSVSLGDALEKAGQGLAYAGVVTAVPGTNQFTIPRYANFGGGAFVGYYAYVFRDAAGAGAAPQGESQIVSAYVTATGTFTTAAFTAAIAVGDEILLLHPGIGAASVAMRGTDNAFLAAVGGALADAASDGDPTSADTAMQYLKQIINTLEGTAGIPAFPAAAAPTNDVSLAEVLRKIYDVSTTALYSMDFWSDVEDLLTITNAAQDLALPGIIVATLPSGATVTHAILMFKYRTVEDTSASINKLDDNGGGNTPAIQIRADTPGSWVDGISMYNDTIQVAASTREGGDVIIGVQNVSSEVDGNDGYDVQFDDAEADGNNLLLRDVQVGLRIWYNVS
jgi:hypothetical protein